MKRLTGIVASAVLAVALAGCSGGGTPEEWADSICSSVEGDIATLAEMPDINAGDMAEVKDAFVAKFTELSGALDNMIAAVGDAGDPPVDGGAEAADNFVTMLNSAKAAIAEVQSNVEGFPENADRAQLLRAMEPLQALAEINPAAVFQEVPELNEAFRNAESCQTLR